MEHINVRLLCTYKCDLKHATLDITSAEFENT